ncbi:cell division protein FtsK [Streptomyces sp. AK02-01A]|uniref:cell division protein FtsK n=1 Tax=Streptomyces sp. AK02-01A TaxID=3028648 RepID=UPI0029B93BF2|nr:cell division protein FtsK [Streptomyces sp. AK02-01A]MDX3855041.1 cell division protein FtsK [Streptomyces sp. AK02-01A]
MNHEEENEHLNQLEADLVADFTPDPSPDSGGDSGADVVDLDKARSARNDLADPSPESAAGQSGSGSADGSVPESRDPSATVMVDGPAPVGPGYLGRLMGAKRRDTIPVWLRSSAELKTATRWAAGHYGHLVGYHALRSPYYAGRLALQSPRGAATFLGGSMRWVADREGEPVRLASVRREDAAEYLKLSRQRDGRVRMRTLVTALAIFVGLGAALAVYVLAPGWLQALSVGAVVLALGAAGTRADAPVVTRAVELPTAPKLTSDIVLRALGSLGVPAINQAQSKGRDGFQFTAPITRDGPGWRAEGNLPYGVTVTDVIERRDRLASGLRRPLGCVWPEAVPDEHTGRLVLWVGDQDMSKAVKPTWPLVKGGAVDLFKPVAFGTDQRGRWVEITLMYIAGVIGAIPRMGKTFLLRLLLLIAALDVRAELHTYDLKGTGDLDPVGDPVSHRHRAGEEEEDFEYALADLREVREVLRQRAKLIRSLPRDLCPESKVTSELASKRKLGLHPIVIGVDECQKWFEHPKYGAEFEEICTDLVKRGPATGIVLLLATQRPDAKALPTGISANASARWCLKVMGQLENDMVLGTSSYKRGIRATMFAWGDKGIHYFVGEGADARIVSAANIDAVVAERIALRARKLREAAGTLSGYALGEAFEVSDTSGETLLADVLAVIPADEAKVWNESVVERLADLRPERYGDWARMSGEEQTAHLTAALKPYGIAVGQVGRRIDGKFVNKRGIKRADIASAVAERDENRDAS